MIYGAHSIRMHYYRLQTPVLDDLAFPCAASSLYGHYNPLNITASPSPTIGTDDQYEIGDLSGKVLPYYILLRF